jgi:hypothetical protein
MNNTASLALNEVGYPAMVLVYGMEESAACDRATDRP